MRDWRSPKPTPFAAPDRLVPVSALEAALLAEARELEAELLLRNGQAGQAISAFRRQLARTPNRIVTLGGLARASVAAGRTDLAERAYRSLADLLSQADANQPELIEAHAFLSELERSASH